MQRLPKHINKVIKKYVFMFRVIKVGLKKHKNIMLYLFKSFSGPRHAPLRPATFPIPYIAQIGHENDLKLFNWYAAKLSFSANESFCK